MSLLAFTDNVTDINLAIVVFPRVGKVFSLLVLIGLKLLSVSLFLRSSTKDLAPLCHMLYNVIWWSLVSFGATQPDKILIRSSPLYSNGFTMA